MEVEGTSLVPPVVMSGVIAGGGSVEPGVGWSNE